MRSALQQRNARGPGDSGAVRATNGPVSDPDEVLRRLKASLDGEAALVALFVSPEGDLTQVERVAEAVFPDSPVMGCTTAGEIGADGYADGELVALGFNASQMAAKVVAIDGIAGLDPEACAEHAAGLRASVYRQQPDWRWEFAFLLVDGLSRMEDQLVAALRLGLGGIPLFGGSAGDALRFGSTQVLEGGRFRSDAAVLAVVRTRCPVQVFKYDHFSPSEVKMVVTEADPQRRVVREINAEPAALEYARLVGKDPAQLSPFVFAAHPVVVTIGGQHHVRAIQKVEDNGDLTFYSAIDEGVVLTLAEPQGMAEHLEKALGSLSIDAPPEYIVACDCILRRIEVEQKQQAREISEMLSRNNVVGFNTYGEQYNAVHVNQTFTGVAIFAPEEPT